MFSLLKKVVNLYKCLNVIFSENNMLGILNKACNNDPAICPNACGHSFRGTERKGNLKKHLLYTCGVNPQFKCIVCHKRMRRMQSLRYHMATAHSRIT